MTNKRSSLDAYPCPIGLDEIHRFLRMCNAECRARVDAHEDTACRFLDIYRRAEADHRCARLLRVFLRRWRSEIVFAIEDPSSWIQDAQEWWRKWSMFTAAIRDALRAAGLE